ncbi:MAG: isopentenyl-diphosphate Delta-isomerase [Pseudomonadota bacterium]
MSSTTPLAPTVSFDSEELILVDTDDNPTGHLRKDRCHDGEGILHRAFSVFLFNAAGDVLLQQRAPGKRLWPGYWSNSCCSHPRAGETMDEAVPRRLQQELGLSAELAFVYKFQYQARFDATGSEHELCWVYVGRCDEAPQPNDNEIAAFRYISPAALDAELDAPDNGFTPWCQLEWKALRGPYADALSRLTLP